MMKPTPCSWAVLLSAACLAAQNNDVERRNPGYLWVEAINHPNGNTYPDTRTNPTSHVSATMGVPAGTLSWVWIPRALNDRDTDEQITGFRTPLGPSSATSIYPATVYFPEIKVHKSKFQGSGMVPDLATAPYYTVPETSLVFTAFGYYEQSVTLTTPYLLPRQERDIVLSMKWKGGDSRDISGTLNMWGDAHGQTYKLPVFGFADPAGAVSPVPMAGTFPGYLNFTYFRAEPSVMVQTDWGRSYLPPATPIVGYNVSSYELPAARRAISIGFDLRAGSQYSNAFVIPLLNVGPFFGNSYPLLGQTFELNLLDPALGLLKTTTLDSQGHGTTGMLALPALGTGATGLYLGIEFGILDRNFNLKATTQAAWALIDR